MNESEHLKETNKTLLKEKLILEENNLRLTQKNQSLSLELENEKRIIKENIQKAQLELEHFKEKSEITQLLELQKKENELRNQYDKKMDDLRKEMEHYQKLYYESISK